MIEQSAQNITLVGLGPGDPAHLTIEAWELLHDVPEIYVRTRQHPVISKLPPHLAIHSFDHIYEKTESFEQVYHQIVEEVISLAQRPAGVIYAVPGHPLFAEATSLEIKRRGEELDLSVSVVEGLSFLEPTMTALGHDPFPRTTLVDAMEVALGHHPRFPPDAPAVIAQIHSAAVAADVKLTLMAVYPDEHPVRLVHAAGTSTCRVEALNLYEIDRSPYIGLLTSLFVPPLNQEASFEAFQEIIAQLRAPDGCPWDRAQTHLTLRPFLLEEAYEALEALDREDSQALLEELGDLLIQIVLHTQIATELGDFNMSDVLTKVYRKLVHRHPHVFGEEEVTEVSEVKDTWERLKAEERRAQSDDPSALDGVAVALPALAQADAYQKRAAQVGFDWPQLAGVFEKVAEELAEVRDAPTQEAQSAEIGDLIFTIVNLARWYHVDAESVLREANNRFRYRFLQLEQMARQEGRSLGDLSIDEMNSMWEALKK